MPTQASGDEHSAPSLAGGCCRRAEAPTGRSFSIVGSGEPWLVYRLPIDVFHGRRVGKGSKPSWPVLLPCATLPPKGGGPRDQKQDARFTSFFARLARDGALGTTPLSGARRALARNFRGDMWYGALCDRRSRRPAETLEMGHHSRRLRPRARPPTKQAGPTSKKRKLHSSRNTQVAVTDGFFLGGEGYRDTNFCSWFA